MDKSKDVQKHTSVQRELTYCNITLHERQRLPMISTKLQRPSVYKEKTLGSLSEKIALPQIKGDMISDTDLMFDNIFKTGLENGKSFSKPKHDSFVVQSHKKKVKLKESLTAFNQQKKYVHISSSSKPYSFGSKRYQKYPISAKKAKNRVFPERSLFRNKTAGSRKQRIDDDLTRNLMCVKMTGSSNPLRKHNENIDEGDGGDSKIRYLNEEDYRLFRDELLKNIPEYFLLSYLDKEINCICIDVQKGTLYKAKRFLQWLDPLLYQQNFFDVLEQQSTMVFAADDKQFTALSDSSDYTSSDDRSTFYVKPGLELVVKREKEPLTGTLGAVMVDDNGDYYGVTTQHIFSKSLEIHQEDIETSIRQSKEGFIPFSKRCKGVLKKVENEIVVDIAALPIDVSSDRIVPYFTHNHDNTPIPMAVCSSELPKDHPVQIHGAKTGKVTYGKVIARSVDIYELGKWKCTNSFIVADKNEPFAQLGDSGAFVTDVLDCPHPEGCQAYGLVSMVSTGPYIVRKDKTQYNGATTCVSLSRCLEVLSQNFDLKLKFCQVDKTKSLSSCNDDVGSPTSNCAFNKHACAAQSVLYKDIPTSHTDSNVLVKDTVRDSNDSKMGLPITETTSNVFERVVRSTVTSNRHDDLSQHSGANPGSLFTN